MIILVLIVVGLCFGSLVNAVVWRLHEQHKTNNQLKPNVNLSVITGRSVCVNCYHLLSPIDLIPVVSWIALRGKCRYCKKAISWQYPIVELITMIALVTSYLYWPLSFNTRGMIDFAFWAIIIILFMVLAVYDFRWMILPNKLVYLLIIMAVGLLIVNILYSVTRGMLMIDTLWGVGILAGLFYLLFIVSKGRWIGGGDVKLAVALGILAGGPVSTFFILFLASLLGTLYAAPSLVSGKMKRRSTIPFGPFLMLATFITFLFGASIIHYYTYSLLSL
jgi:prepilin signal peptidase PulO-like enzyme (type II secretory pathway)